ncbi:MAG: RidA family protein [Candidatus Omnitrophica bacterium]|nr:RidA family protein [Candidatus Omnitrophota bacterium]
MNYEETLKKLNLAIPEPPKPAGAYQPVVEAGGLAFLSGQISKDAGGQVLSGKVGRDLTLKEGREAARMAAMNAIALIRSLIGFDRFEKIVRVVGYVQSAPDFYEISKVMDGASELFQSVFGEAGLPARSALGLASLPLNAAVEIEVTVQLKPKE